MPTLAVNPALGVYAKLGIGAAAPVTQALDFQSESLGLDESMIDTSGMRGTRSRMAARNVPNYRQVRGDIVLTPTAVELAAVLPYVTGAAAVGTTYGLGETLTPFVVQILRATGSLFTYTGCKVNTATFRSTPGAALGLTLGLMGLDETVANAAFPTLTLDSTTQPFLMSDLSLSVAGNVVQAFDFELTIDNRLQARQVNSLTATAITPTDREITLNATVPFGDASTLYALSSAGVAVVGTFVSGNTSLVCTLEAVQLPRQPIGIPNREEIRMTLRGGARYATNPGSECVFVLDSTP